jgi:hypothetical protein
MALLTTRQPSLMPAHRCLLRTSRVIAWMLSLILCVLSPLAMPAAARADVPGTLQAQAAPSVFEQGPASSEQLALYARIASVNTCIASAAGEDFEQAAGVAGETIAQLILAVHQGLIPTSGSTPLTLEDLRKGSINAAVIGATEICPKQVPAELRDKVKQALASQPSITRG